MRTVLLLISIPLALIGVLLVSWQYFENPMSRFQTYEEMVASGLVERGWIPPYLPVSAFDIQERHNIDTNRVDMIFRFDPSDIAKPEEECKLVYSDQRGRKYFCPPFDSGTSVLLLGEDGRGYYVGVQDSF